MWWMLFCCKCYRYVDIYILVCVVHLLAIRCFCLAEHASGGISAYALEILRIRYSRSSSKHLLIFSLRYSRQTESCFANVIPIRSEGSQQHKLGACSKLLGVIYRLFSQSNYIFYVLSMPIESTKELCAYGRFFYGKRS